MVASLNGVSRGGWASYASRLEEAGASALELNVYYVSSRPGLSGGDVEWHYLDVVRAVRRATRLPLAVKLSPYFSSLTNMAGQLVEAGADGLVLFNRFYQPDLDIETMEVPPALALSIRPSCACRCAGSPSCTAATGVAGRLDGVHTATTSSRSCSPGRRGHDDLGPAAQRPRLPAPARGPARDWMDGHGSRPSTSSAAASASARSPTRPPSSGPTTSRPWPPAPHRSDGPATGYPRTGRGPVRREGGGDMRARDSRPGRAT